MVKSGRLLFQLSESLRLYRSEHSGKQNGLKTKWVDQVFGSTIVVGYSLYFCVFWSLNDRFGCWVVGRI